MMAAPARGEDEMSVARRLDGFCSDLFAAVFGERGRHARSAVGMSSLPGGIPVEIEAILEIG
jgi:enamine deaminase RidA (YjgF/YER057c/UK114 family)